MVNLVVVDDEIWCLITGGSFRTVTNKTTTYDTLTHFFFLLLHLSPSPSLPPSIVTCDIAASTAAPSVSRCALLKQPRTPFSSPHHHHPSPFFTSSPNPNPNPNKTKLPASSHKQHNNNKKKILSKGNSDPNTFIEYPNSGGKSGTPVGGGSKIRSPLPPRPLAAVGGSLIRKLDGVRFDVGSGNGNCSSNASDSGVKVIVRMRPLMEYEEGADKIVEKLSNDSLTINGQIFTFYSVADTEASQVDIFRLVGAPLVENCLGGYSSTVFAYGQTGSGKTYTLWGPANTLLKENLSSDKQGLTPRVFECLFARISEEQIKHADKQLRYQCRCSFLELYNEQIRDLLDRSQKNLQIREDV